MTRVQIGSGRLRRTGDEALLCVTYAVAHRRLGRCRVAVLVSSHARLGEAISNLPASLAAVPVVLPRPERRHGVTATEVLGSIEPTAIKAVIADGRASADDLVLHHIGQPLPTVGVGQPVSIACEALGAHPAAIVLVDGRAVALITRDELRTESIGR